MVAILLMPGFGIQPSMLSLPHYLFLSGALLLVGVIGALTRRNLLIRLFSIELILSAAAINLAAFARLFADTSGQTFALFVAVLGVIEGLVLLAIGTAAFRRWQEVATSGSQERQLAERNSAISPSTPVQP